MTGGPWRRIYPLLRWGFFLASIVFLAVFAHATLTRGGASLWPMLRAASGETALSAVFFLLAAMATVPAWRALLRALGVASAPPRTVLRIFCLTQIAKYVPGNIGHHVGRVALARSALGIPAATTALSILHEGALVVAAAVIVGVASYAVPHTASAHDHIGLLIAALLGGFGVLALVNRHRTALAGNGGSAWRGFVLRAAPTWPAVRRALPCYVFVHVANGVAVACIASAFMPMDLPTFALLARAYALSWVLGFLLPGAPGGLGVRESAFVLLASPACPPDVVLAVATLSRIGNIAADLLIFLAGGALSAMQAPSSTERNRTG
ncbi:putative transmembrane protein HieC [Lysobacter dokdonensis DS-58]|uniref:Putative transmembrane protein HieC n=1 Tax=Lysobacter dokdonensis DS-58 TaxID=1300345 RepID=A0A0A2WLW2_9GAMM|nr:YbhN family protein [Lysobacter dokdonensis]KGQ20808.1 putative transmembrane protein HieC [Lysobacter dokdonensis DS-58]